MRQLFAFVTALIGGYLLWKAATFARVLLVLDDQRYDATMLLIAGALAGISLIFLVLAWMLFRRRPPPAPPAP